MKLTDGEKLILIMLSEMYEKLGIKGEIEPDFIKSAIFSDQTWGIGWKYSGLPFEETETPEIVKEVVDILDMWRFIEDAYEKLSDDEKNELEKRAAPFGKEPKFGGFDFNNESEHVGAMNFLINDLDRFSEFGERYLNTHSQVLDGYRKMLAVFEPMRNNLSHRYPILLNLEELVTILNAKKYREDL